MTIITEFKGDVARDFEQQITDLTSKRDNLLEQQNALVEKMADAINDIKTTTRLSAEYGLLSAQIVATNRRLEQVQRQRVNAVQRAIVADYQNRVDRLKQEIADLKTFEANEWPAIEAAYRDGQKRRALLRNQINNLQGDLAVMRIDGQPIRTPEELAAAQAVRGDIETIRKAAPEFDAIFFQPEMADMWRADAEQGLGDALAKVKEA